MGFLKDIWRKLKPERTIGKALAEDYARRKLEKEIGNVVDKVEPQDK